MNTPSWWRNRSLLSTLLLPAGWIYGSITALRLRVAKPERIGVPVICVGNLTAGGAGKTPVTLAIADMLKAQGVNTFIVSRGYGGRLTGPVLVDPALHSAAEVGDEPLLLARALPTVVAKNRREGARFAAAQGARLLLLDDGFQNPTLHKDISVIVIDGAYGFGNERLIPAGPLRERPEAGLKRADVVIALGDIPPLPVSLPVVKARIAPVANTLASKRVIGFAGLAHPEKFRRTLEEMGAEVVEFHAFADHHPYTPHQLERLARHAEAAGATLATTAKDAVRLPEDFRVNVTVVDITLTFDQPEALTALLARVL